MRYSGVICIVIFYIAALVIWSVHELKRYKYGAGGGGIRHTIWGEVEYKTQDCAGLNKTIFKFVKKRETKSNQTSVVKMSIRTTFAFIPSTRTGLKGDAPTPLVPASLLTATHTPLRWPCG